MRVNPYESRQYINEYLLLHYGRIRDVCPFDFIPRELLRFHERIRRECMLPVRTSAPTRGLDIGCAAGRFTFELGRVVDRTVGIDTSRHLIEAARRMARHHSMTVQMTGLGAQSVSCRLTVPVAMRRCAVQFRIADAQNLAAFPDGFFHVVAAINLLCRLPRPRQFLSQLHRLLVPGGQLVVASPFSWLEDYTPRREWLSQSDVDQQLHPHFRVVRRQDLPFVIREHLRKYQLVVSSVSVYVRRPV